MADPAGAVKGAFTKTTGKKALLVGTGIAIAEIIDYGIKVVGKTDKVPDGVSGLVIAPLAALAKQPAVTVGALADTGMRALDMLTGYDITKPKEQVDNMTKRTSDEPTSGIQIAE